MAEMSKAILFFVLAFILLVAGCSSKPEVNSGAVIETGHAVNIDKLEIIHFHGTNQCYSCKTMGAYAEETISTYFPKEVSSGRIVFKHINGELLENTEITARYGATGSSLWIGVYDKQGFHKEVNNNVWYKIGDKQEYMGYLKGVIEQKLAGN